MDQLSHVDHEGRARMVDVGAKRAQHRMARAIGTIAMSPNTGDLIRQNQIQKGDVFGVAQIAGIQAAKRTAELIPLCHPLAVDKIDVRLELTEQGVTAESEVCCVGRTGVEMEALVAVSVALLTVYDMCKAVDTSMRIQQLSLIEKVKGDVSEH
jgi:cyclic pyranopterin monophosphate synthase